MSDFFNTLWKHNCLLRKGDKITLNFGVTVRPGEVACDSKGNMHILVEGKSLGEVLYKCYDHTRVAGLLGAYYIKSFGNHISTLIPDVEEEHWFIGDHSANLVPGTTHIHRDCAVVDEKHKIIWLQVARNASSSIVYNSAICNTDLTFPTDPNFCIWTQQQKLWDRGVLVSVSEAAKLKGYRIVCVFRKDPFERWLSGVSVVQKGYSYPYIAKVASKAYKDNTMETYIRRAAIVSACYSQNNILLDPHLSSQSSQIESWLSIYRNVSGVEQNPDITWVELRDLDDWFFKEYGEVVARNNTARPLPEFDTSKVDSSVKEWVMRHILADDVKLVIDHCKSRTL